MRAPQKCENEGMRLILSIELQKFIDDIDTMYPKEPDKPSDEQIKSLKDYFRRHYIPIPIIPDDDRHDSAIKSMYRVWAALECNDLMCSLTGTENHG
jgi:hypothetical protein